MLKTAVPVRAGVLAGLVGGVLIEAYLALASGAVTGEKLAGMLQWTASALLGKTAFSSQGAVWLGLVLHFIVSVAWAVAFAVVAAQRPATNRSPLLAGAVFGLVVMIVMQVVLVVGNMAPPPTVTAVVNALIAHVVFFGIPVALIVARSERSAGS